MCGTRNRDGLALPTRKRRKRYLCRRNAHIKIINKFLCLSNHRFAIKRLKRPVRQFSPEKQVHINRLQVDKRKILKHYFDTVFTRI